MDLVRLILFSGNSAFRKISAKITSFAWKSQVTFLFRVHIFPVWINQFKAALAFSVCLLVFIAMCPIQKKER